MEDYRWLWKHNPSLYVVVERTSSAVFWTPEREVSVCLLDKQGAIISGKPLPRSVSLRYQTMIRYENQKGDRDYRILTLPRYGYPPVFVGVMCDRDEALRRARNDSDRAQMIDHPSGLFFVNPVGTAWPFDNGDELRDPELFGLSIPAVPTAPSDI